MNQEQFGVNTIGSELSEQELMLVQGGSFLGDLGHAVASAVDTVGDALSDGVHAVGDALSKGAQAIADGLAARAWAEVKRTLFRFHF
jgi:hypothetical protein